MKVKKRDLRKRLAQVPINYPGPDIVPFDLNAEKARVENLAKRLADNEAEVRDAVLGELPAYIREVCATAMSRRRDEVKNGEAPDAESTEGIDMDHFEAGLKLWERLMSSPAFADLAILMEKLCLGLHFCMWHSDKPLVQHECAVMLVELMNAPPTVATRDMMYRAMLRTLVRQWLKIDQWRMDKYMALVRKFFFAMVSHIDGAVDATGAAAAAAAPSATPSSKAGKKGRASKASADVPVVEAPAAAPNVSLKRLSATYQYDVVRSESVGLTMHLADVALTELLRCEKLTAEGFVALARAMPMYIMQRGNMVEKRVLDNFVVPLAAGFAEDRRGEEFSVAVCDALAQACDEMSISRGTHFTVRPLMVESQRLFENYVGLKRNPDMFEPVTKRDERHRIAAEVRAAEKAKMGMSRAVAKCDAIASAARRKIAVAKRASKPQTSGRSKRWKK